MDNNSTTNLLNGCKPNKAVEARQRQKDVIKRPASDEAFLITPHSIELACIAEPRALLGAQYAGETYHPVIEELQDRAGGTCKRIVFHACISVTGAKFLLHQKLPADNSWNKSMEHVVEEGSKGPIKMSSNQEIKQYKVEQCDVEIPNTATKQDLVELCEKAFADLIINQPDNPALRKAMGVPDIYGDF